MKIDLDNDRAIEGIRFFLRETQVRRCRFVSQKAAVG